MYYAMHTPIGDINVRNAYDEAVVKETVLEHQYERWGDIKIEGNVIDAGAFIGDFTKLALFNGCTVTAVEPDPGNLEMLRINAPKAIIVPKAITNDKLVHFYQDRERAELNKIANSGILVEGITLDQLITKPVDLLKMDIEGGEYDAIYGSNKLKDMVKQITMEYHNGLGKVGELMWYLGDIGFQFGWIGGQDWGHLQCKNKRFK